ncbi:UDP-2,3-diacylglucosamine diphosphatase LpxI [Hyphobacterium sp. HN65]|uniref:UDP-2,3-diacylglucosamine diphosphatase LpxI n=1 Tax=Hyphobacterium lacteum TaxID=3116575 RepID=A0ABU7LMT4_9PROT|nr:UDP-2,3-diacylglucosamine diphosphatase LpxI [Hyphobacterium sp. HN65]MEE2524904.1 UDP-2,3-diacylglucosamine diphosphatase LpxI [Hyphobacterium sp. HN65]
MTDQPKSDWKRLAIIAGGGEIPSLVARGELAAGRSPFVVEVEGFADQDYSRFESVRLPIPKVGGMQKAIVAAGCDAVCFIGRITRPNFKSLMGLDTTAMGLLPRITQAARYGDDALMRVIIDSFESKGLRAIGADEAMSSLVPEAGVLGSIEPDEIAREDIRKALKIARAIGEHDIGQGAVVANGLVLAIEAQEGTDEMLARIFSLPPDIRGNPQSRLGVLAKTPKPRQERRIDLPTIGLRTIDGASRAGLSGIAVIAGSALIPRMDETIAAADAAGLFIYAAGADE